MPPLGAVGILQCRTAWIPLETVRIPLLTAQFHLTHGIIQPREDSSSQEGDSSSFWTADFLLIAGGVGAFLLINFAKNIGENMHCYWRNWLRFNFNVVHYRVVNSFERNPWRQVVPLCLPMVVLDCRISLHWMWGLYSHSKYFITSCGCYAMGNSAIQDSSDPSWWNVRFQKCWALEHFPVICRTIMSREHSIIYYFWR